MDFEATVSHEDMPSPESEDVQSQDQELQDRLCAFDARIGELAQRVDRLGWQQNKAKIDASPIGLLEKAFLLRHFFERIAEIGNIRGLPSYVDEATELIGQSVSFFDQFLAQRKAGGHGILARMKQKRLLEKTGRYYVDRITAIIVRVVETMQLAQMMSTEFAKLSLSLDQSDAAPGEFSLAAQYLAKRKATTGNAPTGDDDDLI